MIKKLPGGSFRRARWRLESTEDGTVPAMRRSEKVDFVKDNFGSPYKHNLLRFVEDNLYIDFYVIFISFRQTVWRRDIADTVSCQLKKTLIANENIHNIG